MQLSERDQLILDNRQLVYFTLHKYFPNWGQDEDLQQIGMMALCEAADKYNPEKGNFSTFAVTNIRNQLCKEFDRRSAQCRKGEELSVNAELQDGVTLEDCLPGDDDVDFCDREALFKVLKPNERKIAEWLEKGYSQAEICRLSGYKRGHVSFLVRNVRRKWRKFYEN